MKNSRKLVERSVPTLLLLAFILSASVVAHHNDERQQGNAPKQFTYTELFTLYEEESLPAAIEGKLPHLLTVPFVENRHTSAEPLRLSRNPQLGEFLRVAFWNIERGLEYEAIEAALSDERRFAAIIEQRDTPNWGLVARHYGDKIPDWGLVAMHYSEMPS